MRKCFLLPHENNKDEDNYFGIKKKLPIKEVEKFYMLHVRRDYNGNVEEASKILDIKLKTLYDRLQKYRSVIPEIIPANWNNTKGLKNEIQQ